MGIAARDYALTCSWDAVFDRVYLAYGELCAERRRSGEGVFSSPG